MGFWNQIEDEFLNGENNQSITENGAIGFASTGKNLLDLNFAVSSLRRADDKTIARSFVKAYGEDKMLALKWLMYCRDVRGGLGERKTPRVIFNYLAKSEPKVMKALIELIPAYGRFDDLYSMFDTPVADATLKLIGTQLKEDIDNMNNNKPISILAKWIPSENASSKETAAKAKVIRKYLGMKPKEYRKTLSALRKYLDVVERKMSSGEWAEINYETVPSKANVLYRNAFMRHDGERRNQFFMKLNSGEAKINSSVNFPHDIVHAYGKGYRGWGELNVSKDDSLEALWKNLPDTVGKNNDTLVVRDGSGSMTVGIDNKTSITALEVSTALAVYFSEHMSGEFKDKFITFSAKPKLINLSNCDDLVTKLRKCYAEDDCSNTNIEKTFDLILDTAISNNLKQEEMPKNVLIISDMEFDMATRGYDYTCNKNSLFGIIAKRFKKHGYQLPRLVFWNVNSRTNTIPVIQNDLGIALVSGFSTNICKMVLSGELDPYKCLLEQLNTDRYKPVEDAVKEVLT